MGLFEFFFPQVAAAEHLREIAETQAHTSVRDARRTAGVEARVMQLERDLGYAVLVLGSILDRLDQKGVVTRGEVKAAMAVLDDLDGMRDGSLDINVLRGRHG